MGLTASSRSSHKQCICETVKILDESNEKGKSFFAVNARHKTSRSTESNADLISMNAVMQWFVELTM